MCSAKLDLKKLGPVDLVDAYNLARVDRPFAHVSVASSPVAA